LATLLTLPQIASVPQTASAFSKLHIGVRQCEPLVQALLLFDAVTYSVWVHGAHLLRRSVFARCPTCPIGQRRLAHQSRCHLSPERTRNALPRLWHGRKQGRLQQAFHRRSKSLHQGQQLHQLAIAHASVQLFWGPDLAIQQPQQRVLPALSAAGQECDDSFIPCVYTSLFSTLSLARTLAVTGATVAVCRPCKSAGRFC